MSVRKQKIFCKECKLAWPAVSSDLNTIENVESMLIRNVYEDGKHYKIVQHRSVKIVQKEAIRNAWRTLSVQSLLNLTESMPKRIFQVINRNRGSTVHLVLINLSICVIFRQFSMKYRSVAILLKCPFFKFFLMIKNSSNIFCFEKFTGKNLFKRNEKRVFFFFKIFRHFLIALNQQKLNEAIIMKRSVHASI